MLRVVDAYKKGQAIKKPSLVRATALYVHYFRRESMDMAILYQLPAGNGSDK